MEENTQVKKEEAEILENAQQNGEKKWKKYVRIGFLLLVAVFLIRYFYKNYDSYKNLDIEINWPVFAGALLFYFIYQVTLASLWHYITKLNKCSIQYFKAITAYLRYRGNIFRERFLCCWHVCRCMKKAECRSEK